MIKKIFNTIYAKLTWWNFLKITLLLMSLIVLLYVEEDWRGARAWAALQEDLKKQGESLDESTLVAPPVSEEQNFGALPLFKLEPDLKDPSRQRALNLYKANNKGHMDLNLNYNKAVDSTALRARISEEYQRIFHHPSPLQNPLEDLDAICTYLPNLREEAKQRSDCRFENQDVGLPIFERSVDLIAAQMPLSKIVMTHAFLALERNQPDIATDDFRINFRILKGTLKSYDLVSGLVSSAILSVNQKALKIGFQKHLWKEEEVSEIEKEFRQYDFLNSYKIAMRREAIAMIFNVDHLLEDELDHGWTNWRIMVNTIPRRMIPRGWWELTKTKSVAFNFHMIKIMELSSRQVNTKAYREIKQQLQVEAGYPLVCKLFNMIFLRAALSEVEIFPQFAKAQSLVDQTLIACALERYWLHHQAYPAHLEDLTSAEAPLPLPHDVMTGEPYRYRLNADGTYLLYSVGWDQKDDQGTPVEISKLSEGTGDWVW